MKQQLLRLLVPMVLGLTLFSSCGKDKNAPGGSNNTFSFSNSEYTGIAKAGNHYYPRPVSIRFNGDSTLSTFTYIVLNQSYKLVTGKITNVSTAADGKITIGVKYNLPEEAQFNYAQTYFISADKQTLSGGAFPLYEIVSMKLYPAKAVSISGNWNTPDGYPDIAGMSFQKDSTATYTRGGKTITYGGDPTTVIHIAYHQDGGRLTFSGINQSQNDLLIPYYGVSTADGKTIYSDSYDFSNARLPSFYGSEGNGPIGVTPKMIKL